MAYSGRADSNGIALVISLDSGWTLTLQRHDFKPDEALGQCFGKELSGTDLKKFLPDWSTLTWWTHPGSELQTIEWTATSEAYFLRLTQLSAGGEKWAALAAFLRLMNNN